MLLNWYVIHGIRTYVEIICFYQMSLLWSSFCWESTYSGLRYLNFRCGFVVSDLSDRRKFENLLLFNYFGLDRDFIVSRSFYVKCYRLVFSSFRHLNCAVSTFQDRLNILPHNFFRNQGKCFTIIKPDREIIGMRLFTLTALAGTSTTIDSFVKNSLTSFVEKFGSNFDVLISSGFVWVCTFLVISSLLTFVSNRRVTELVRTVNKACFK